MQAVQAPTVFKQKLPFIHFLNNNIQKQLYSPIFRTSLWFYFSPSVGAVGVSAILRNNESGSIGGRSPQHRHCLIRDPTRMRLLNFGKKSWGRETECVALRGLSRISIWNYERLRTSLFPLPCPCSEISYDSASQTPISFHVSEHFFDGLIEVGEFRRNGSILRWSAGLLHVVIQGVYLLSR